MYQASFTNLIFRGDVMTVKSRIFICLVSGLALFLVGAYKIFTNHLEAMSQLVAYMFFVCGFIGFVFSSVSLFRTARN